MKPTPSELKFEDISLAGMGLILNGPDYLYVGLTMEIPGCIRVTPLCVIAATGDPHSLFNCFCLIFS